MRGFAFSARKQQLAGVKYRGGEGRARQGDFLGEGKLFEGEEGVTLPIP